MGGIAFREIIGNAAIPVAWEYDVDPANLRVYLSEVRRLVEEM